LASPGSSSHPNGATRDDQNEAGQPDYFISLRDFIGPSTPVGTSAKPGQASIAKKFAARALSESDFS
jgi:hypothetical protein